ncbi:MAG: beta-ketoacyl synthase chain length factor [Nevskiales bacterium]
MSALNIFVDAIGLAAPGLNGWAQGSAVLAGQLAYAAEELPRYAPELLPPNERRRATAVGRLAFQSAEEAIGQLNGAAADLAAVFASSGGDTDIVNLICSSLATPQRPVSPTHFHNSVHNAAAGYWSIATGSRKPSTSLSAFDGSFGAGLMEAAVLCASEAQPVLLVAYDSVPGEPLHEKRPLSTDFSIALLLRPQAGPRTLASLALNYCHDQAETRLDDDTLEALRQGNPAARALPLLQALAQQQATEMVLPAVQDIQLAVSIKPVS